MVLPEKGGGANKYLRYDEYLREIEAIFENTSTRQSGAQMA